MDEATSRAQVADMEFSPVGSNSPAHDTKLLDNLLVIAKASRALLALRLADIDLNVGQDQMIDLLSFGVPNNVGHVADTLNVRPSTVSKMADRLCAMGLVEKRAAIDDARCTELWLTEDGAAKKNAVHECWSSIEEELTKANPVLADPALRTSLQEIDLLLRARLARLR